VDGNHIKGTTINTVLRSLGARLAFGLPAERTVLGVDEDLLISSTVLEARRVVAEIHLDRFHTFVEGRRAIDIHMSRSSVVMNRWSAWDRDFPEFS
jgi:hypothetical protein